MISLRRSHFAVLTSAVLLWVGTPLQAQERTTPPAITAESFQRPPAEIADAVLAPRHLNVTLSNPSPDGTLFLIERSGGAPTMADFAKPFYRLAGEQIDWRANRSRRLTTRAATGLEIVNRETGNTTSIDVPEGARVSSATWSPDGSSVAFFAHLEDETHIFVADPANGRSRQITRSAVLATVNTSFAWTPDSRSIVTTLVPAGRGAAPAAPAVPTSPQVRITTPDENRVRTYPDLLQDPFEMELLEYYSTGQLAVIEVQARSAHSLGEPAMITEVDVSPDGQFALVSTMRGPFSYTVPRSQFATAQAIWSLADGSVLAMVSEHAVRLGTPADTAALSGPDPDKRSATWRPDGQGLGFLQSTPKEAKDDDQIEEPAGRGPGARRDGQKDRVMQWLPPFDAESVSEVYENDNRISQVRYTEDAQTLILSEQSGRSTSHDFAIRLSDPSEKHTIWRGERSRGFRRNRRVPQLLTKTLGNGTSVVRVSSDGQHVFHSGTEYHDDPTQDGPQAYLDRVAIDSGEKERVYESENADVFERVLEVLNDDATQLIVSRESKTEVPDSYFRNLDSGQLTQITENTDYTPDLTRADRRTYAVTRVDGIEIAVHVTLPEAWNGERLPAMFWFYPREYTGQDSYDEQVRDFYNKNAFPNLRARSMDVLVRRGYVLVEPDSPIIGDEGRLNDNYVHDLRNNLSATIDFLDKEGIIDRERLGVGGHSYGAFSTMNAMVHTPFFKAGIAGDGNYNRTLTPFSFQSERRTLWQAKDVYFSMSPLFFANNMSGALLMYHGADDQNTGTFPINSWRLFESLEALGKTASLYVYPFEEHGPATEETLLDLWARWSAWLDLYVKGAGEVKTQVTTDASAGSVQ